MEEFMRKTRPIIERSEFEATSKVRQNIRNISEMQQRKQSQQPTSSRPNSQAGPVSIFDAESVTKRQKRLQKIEKACQILERREKDPTMKLHSTQNSQSERSQHLFDNEIIKIVSRTSRALKDKLKAAEASARIDNNQKTQNVMNKMQP